MKASQDLFRFSMTYGLLLLLGLCLTLFAYAPFKNHIIQTQRITAFKAKNSILGYQTPDFKHLAAYILAGHLFTSEDLINYRPDAHYLAYLPFYEKAATLFPDSFEMHYFKGVCYLWIGDLAQAKSSLERSLEINKTFFWTYYNLALTDLRIGDANTAFKLLAMAQNLNPLLTEKAMFELEAFRIIWSFIPVPGDYIHHHLVDMHEQIDHLNLTEIEQWHPIFF